MTERAVIGVFDSGIGGLTVWREITRILPDVPTIYLADQAFVPYGERPEAFVCARTLTCVEWLVEQGCDPVVVACNTASAVALEAVRRAFPSVGVVGMEPAVKPAAQQTRTGVVGVLATAVTLRSARYAALTAQWRASAQIIERACPTWVTAVETCETNAQLQPCVEACLVPMLEAGADVIVLGCTHFPFLLPWIERSVEAWRVAHAAEREVRILDPSPAVARQVVRLWKPRSSPNGTHALQRFYTTGEALRFEQAASFWLGQPVRAASLTSALRVPA
ncbi:MAG: glutamate racemase [Thermoflexales bacterium]|nr:glutamate racemase [Thermoflexales bacterium]